MKRIRKGFSSEYHLINHVLMEWNPIGVIGIALLDEYVSYIPRLIRVKDNSESLLKELEEILTGDLGMTYDATDLKQRQALVDVVNKIKGNT